MAPGIPDFFFVFFFFAKKLALKTNQLIRERSGSMVECLTRDRRAAGSSLTGIVVSLSKNINPSLVIVQPRKTRPFITKRLLMGRKESNQTNQHTKYAKRVNRHTIFKSSAKHVPVFMILEVRQKN